MLFTNPFERDQHWMQEALKLAEQAARHNEVPVGAVLILEDQVIAQGWNQPIGTNDPSAHAEIITLRRGAGYMNSYRLSNSTLYVTLEPCIMCVGAMLHSRIKRLVYGAADPKTGAVASQFHLLDAKHNHRIEWEGGCLEQRCGSLLKVFFEERR